MSALGHNQTIAALVQKQTNAGTALSATSIFNGRELAEVAGFAVR
jgi:hypothetical protein